MCPANPEYLVGVVVNYLLLGKLPDLDQHGRPKMFYGQTIHDNCERRAHFDAGRFVEKFGSQGRGDELLPLQDGLQGAHDLLGLPEDP